MAPRVGERGLRPRWLDRIARSQSPTFEQALGGLAVASPISIAATNAALIFCGAVFVRDWLAGRRRPMATPLDGAILVWVLANVLAGVASLEVWRSFRDLRNLGHWSIYYLMVWGIICPSTPPERREGRGELLTRLQNLWIVSGCVAALAGMAQVTIGFDHLGRELPKAVGFFSGHLSFAHYMVLLLTVTVARWIDSSDRPQRWLLMVGILLLGGGLVSSEGRGAWLTFLAISAVLALYGGGRRILLPVALVAVMQVGYTARETGGLARFYRSYVDVEAKTLPAGSQDPAYSNLWRLTMWREGLRLFSTRPFSGTGVETTGRLSRQFRTPFEDFGVAHLHSNYFEILMTRGFVGLVAFVLLLLVALRMLGASLAVARPGPERAAVLGGVGAILAHVLHGLTYFTVGSAPIQMGFYVVLGMATGAVLKARRAEDFSEERFTPAPMIVAVAVAAVLTPFQSWLAQQTGFAIALGAVAAVDLAVALGRGRRDPSSLAMAASLAFVLLAALALLPTWSEASRVIVAALLAFAVIRGVVRWLG